MPKLILLIIVAAIAGGSIPPFAKIALEVFQPFTLIAIRFLAASLVLLPFVRRSRELNLRIFRELLGVEVIGAINPILLFIALQFTPALVSPLIYAAVPLMTALFLRGFIGVKIAKDQLLGIVTGFSGVAIIILMPFFQNGGLDLKNFWGNLLIFGAALTFMVYGILSNTKQQTLGISPTALTFYLSLVALAMALPLAAWELAQHPLDPAAMAPRHILAALAIGAVCSSLFFLAYQEAIRLGNELTASLFTYLQPVAGILLAVLLLGEQVTPAFVLGGTLALVGAGLATREKAHSKPNDDIVGLFESSVPDLAENHDAYLADLIEKESQDRP